MAGGKKKENKKDWPEKNGGTMVNYANDFAATGMTGKRDAGGKGWRSEF